MDDSTPGSRVGSRFGPYQLMRLLGRGGMGEVYEAEDTRKHRRVALKLISPQFSGSEAFRARMQREADAAGRLTEPHVVPIHDYGEIDGQFYVEMRLIEGTDLATLLRQGGPMSPARAVAIVRQIAAALDAAHAIGVTHRDVKPENVLITPDDFAYLVDFGIARAAADPGLTQTGAAVGTYNYMAPERFSGDEVTYRADIYSLACVLGECLIGSPPYRAESIERMVAAHLIEPPPRPSELRPGIVPVGLDQVIARGMAKNPRERYSSAGDLASAAHDALTTAEQQRAAVILRQGEEATRATPAVGAATQYPPSGFHPIQQRHSYEHPIQQQRHSYEHPVQQQQHSYEHTMARPAVTGSWRSPAQPSAVAPPAPAPAPAPAAPSFARAGGSDRRRNWILIGAVALLVVAVAGAAVFLLTRPSQSGSAARQTVLGFEGLNFRLSPGGVALDSDGNVYVTNQGMYGHVVKLAPGSTTPSVLPFSGLYEPQGVAVDSHGAVYVTDFNNRVVKLVAGSNSQTELPFTGLNYPEGLAVDDAGDVYVADRGNDRVVKLAAGADTQTVLPISGLQNPDDVALDSVGNVYVTDTDNNRVVKFVAGSQTQADLPFTGLSSPWGVAVDGAGNVYVTNHENHKVMKLAAGSNTQTVLPFAGLNTPLQLAADKDGNLYVADRGNNRVVRLAAG